MENKEKEFVDFVVTARKYKTLLTAKYKDRPVWHKPYQGDVISNLPGTIVKIEVKKGQEVKAGQLLLIHQAMKMYNRIVAPISGVIAELAVKEGDKIGKNHLMIKIDPK
ncbi:acetyl-CoA carboxylase biotin carboxyl carrier protein subunit [Parabacteroides bouchesdurhonensis]|uniref:acetyl-CoA carboxylase biotin carboxyl carrier protein subunit n=1 Tax=Parabacteroides bouchesdurhonensis TaxID=1936995 RepID=UPI000C8460E7|nr:acetyl-CoA carboxylase biotin carboxyl carrier protein subunit [Parabacteroides bouchesdurhonensis]RHJ90641.1 acetyl-CoA carboxylase biotin carboxyl carrier protein subunit [Bacteroides sp. AM07-16]